MTTELAEVLTPQEVAQYLRVSRAQGYKLIRTGEIPSFRVGRLPRVKRQALLKWIESGCSSGATLRS